MSSKLPKRRKRLEELELDKLFSRLTFDELDDRDLNELFNTPIDTSEEENEETYEH